MCRTPQSECALPLARLSRMPFFRQDLARCPPTACPVIVAIYTDYYGSQKANADVTRFPAQVVWDGLVANGVLGCRIERQEIGSVKFESNSQESRRGEIIIGRPSGFT